MNVRPATEQDLPAISEIYNDAVLHTTATYDYEPRPLTQWRPWFEDHHQSGHPVFVAETASRQIVGWSALNRYHDRPGYRFTVENSIYVASPWRGQGVGRRLMEPLIDAAARLGFHAILAVIDADSTASLRLHARFGFEQVAHLREVGFKFDRWLDVVFMQRLI